MNLSVGSEIDVVLVTSSHIASNPRLVKEADALSRAGANVTVVSPADLGYVRELDKTLLRDAKWIHVTVGRYSLAEWFIYTAVSRVCQFLSRFLDPPGCLVATWANSRDSKRLWNASKGIRADLYIAHNLPALPVVARLAKTHSARYGFDAEDFHCGELGSTKKDKALARARTKLEESYLPSTGHITCASPLIARAYERRYGVRTACINNLFAADFGPLPDAMATPAFYWMSQTVGPDRGLEGVITALNELSISVRLDIRGSVDPKYARTLQDMCGPLLKVDFLPPAPPIEMVRLAQGYHFGLSTEQETPEHRNLCLTNKLFTCLAAGVPVLLSETRAQLDFSHLFGHCCRVIDFRNPVVAGKQVLAALEDAETMAMACRSETCFSVEHEMDKFLSIALADFSKC